MQCCTRCRAALETRALLPSRPRSLACDPTFAPCAAAITSARTRSAALHQVQLCIEPSLFLCRLHSSSDVVRTVAIATTSEESVRQSSKSRRAAAADSSRRQASERVAHHVVRESCQGQVATHPVFDLFRREKTPTGKTHSAGLPILARAVCLSRST